MKPGTRGRTKQYNILFAVGKKRPPKGKGLFATPCCFTCVKLTHTEHESKCSFTKTTPNSDLLWGRTQCIAFVPRPLEDYRNPGLMAKTAAGTKILVPGEKSIVRKKKQSNRSMLILSPKETAIIIAPSKNRSSN